MTDILSLARSRKPQAKSRGSVYGVNSPLSAGFHCEPQVLRPFHRSEAMSVAEAASEALKSDRTIRTWCELYDIGRMIGGRWVVSKVALAMWLDGNTPALAAYLAGNRESSLVTDYFRRLDMALPRCGRSA
jgi:hypothetical protein